MKEKKNERQMANLIVNHGTFITTTFFLSDVLHFE